MKFNKLYLYTTNSVNYYEKRGWKILEPFIGNNKKQGMIMELNL